MGKSEVAEKSAMLALRYNGAKEPWQGDVATFGAFVAARLELIQAAMLAKATQERNAKLKVVRFLFFFNFGKGLFGFWDRCFVYANVYQSRAKHEHP